jgi:hypothetical protein
MEAFLVEPDSPQRFTAAQNLAVLLYEKHIYNALCDEYKSLYFAHKLLREIEDGERIIMFSAENNQINGCVHGVLQDGVYTCHIMFKRRIDAVKACLMFEEEMKIFCRKRKIDLNLIRGFIPVFNRAAIRTGKAWGAVDKGISDTEVFWRNGVPWPCHRMEKEIELWR